MSHQVAFNRAMEPLSLIIGGALFLVAIMFLFSSDKNKSHIAKQVNKLPGPTSYPFVGTELPLLFLKRNEFFAYRQGNVDKYKPTFRTWNGSQPQMHITKPEHIEVILRSSDHIDKGQSYSFLHKWLGTGLLTSTGKKWFTHRKLITPTFHFKILDNFVEVFSEKSEILVDKLKKEVGSQGFDVYPYITKCALDIICETAMGTPIYAQDERGYDYVAAVYDMSELTIHRIFRPWLHNDFVFNLTEKGKRHEECLRVLHGFTKRVIQERKAQLEGDFNKSPSTSTDEDSFVGKKKRKAFLDLLLEASTGDIKLTDEELREEVDTFMFEGHDTTSAGMTWALFLLGLHPDVQEKTYEEQKNIFQGSERSVTMKDLNEMKYLERVIKETLRLYPSVPIFGRQLHSEAELGDFTVPAGCSVIMYIYNLHRNPEQFPNPENFDPDNFLPEKVTNRHPYAYIPFSAGPRNCIGQKFALLEEKTVLSYILRNYEVISLDKRQDVNLMAEIVLRPEKGINVSIKPRNK
ncbi:cytochrome P450 4C1-like isoform X1 [Periplaneta americana]|uniref:cytochrome P450 4C1-like isoform X1 n=2 Tax=Periplaneta americana TaxID=6978 RepID=UPI0037E8A940